MILRQYTVGVNHRRTKLQRERKPVARRGAVPRYGGLRYTVVMRIDRLLSIIVHLLNHDVVSAAALADRFGVSPRTIQRDMETIELAGIPIFTVQGPRGGYGIMETYKLDRQMLTVDDFYYIVTALKGVGETLVDQRLDGTLEKVRALLPDRRVDFFSDRDEKLSVDFSMLGGDQRNRATFRTVKEAVEVERLLRFSYTNNKLEQTTREVEPMTLAFRWRSWYLFAWCTLKGDYRLFRVSRMRETEILPRRFRRRSGTFEEFADRHVAGSQGLELTLDFDPAMAVVVREYYPEDACKELPDGTLRVTTCMPEDGWLYGYILSFGRFVRVVAPERLRRTIAQGAREIARLYADTDAP